MLFRRSGAGNISLTLGLSTLGGVGALTGGSRLFSRPLAALGTDEAVFVITDQVFPSCLHQSLVDQHVVFGVAVLEVRLFQVFHKFG